MNQADFGSSPPSNTPRLPPVTGSGTSAFAVIVAMSFAVMATFFVLSFVAVWRRSEASTTPPPRPTTMVVTSNATPPSISTDSEVWLDATVNIKRLEKGPGKLRARPDFNGAEVTELFHGSHVKVARSSLKGSLKWYRVKAERDGTPYEGWMHSDILIIAP